ncbi:MAG: TolC family protein, partial [Phycisphaerae bacterium]|nr:TolC family protein [Phycisphaerae bacterium]
MARIDRRENHAPTHDQNSPARGGLRTRWPLATLVSCVSSALIVGCASNEPPPFDLRKAGDHERLNESYPEARPMRPLPTTLESEFLPPNPDGTPARRPTTAPTTGPALDVQPVVRMTLQEIVHRAVANSLDVRVAGYNPAIDETRVTEAEARFDPSIFANATYERRNRPEAFPLISGEGNVDSENIGTLSGGIQQQLDSGGTISLGYTTTFTNINHITKANQSVSPDPFYENDLSLQINQPLLQGFGADVNRARIVISRNTQKITLLDFRKQLEDTLNTIEKDYWQLAQAERDVQINEALLNETVHTAEVLLNRVGQDVTRVQLSQANASVETRRATLIRARAHVRDLSDELKRQMNDPDLPISGGVLILPANAPIEQALHFDKEDQIKSGLENRFELGQQQFRIDNAGQQLLVAKNLLQPQLNFVGSVGVDGLAGDEGTAIDQLNHFGHISWTAGVQLSIPIGNRAARAAYARAQLQQQQAIDAYRQTIEQVTLDVSEALREVDTTWNELVQNRNARFAQTDVVEALNQREQGGEALTPTFVQLKLDTQERLADARRSENQALANYNIAIYKLEQAKGTLLRYNNVVMAEAPLPQLRTSRNI